MTQTVTRGIRNNNPGNIDRNATNWNGMSDDQSSDARFCVFTSPVFGIRALVKTLISYQDVHGLHTISAMIGRWAPSNENNTDAYRNTVSAHTGYAADAPICMRDPAVAEKMAAAIIAVENAGYAYPPATIMEGVDRALGV